MRYKAFLSRALWPVGPRHLGLCGLVNCFGFLDDSTALQAWAPNPAIVAAHLWVPAKLASPKEQQCHMVMPGSSKCRFVLSLKGQDKWQVHLSLVLKAFGPLISLMSENRQTVTPQTVNWNSPEWAAARTLARHKAPIRVVLECGFVPPSGRNIQDHF